MFPSSLIRTLQLPLVGLANCIRRVHVNHVSFEHADDKPQVLKRRRWFAWAFVFPANIVLRFRQVPLHVLPRGEWIRWERTLKSTLRNETVLAGAELRCAIISGQPLCELLSDRLLHSRPAPDSVKTESVKTESAQSLALLKTATLALKDLHNTSVRQGDAKSSTRLSHGDAAISNVMYCEETDTAEWFDFDLRHDLQVDAVQRHADDLRSLLFSASLFLPAEDLETLVQVIKHEYQCERVWSALQRQLSSCWFWLDLFHLSQTRRLKQRSPATGLNVAEVEKSLVDLVLKTR